MSNPWDRLEDETDRAFEGFTAWRLLGLRREMLAAYLSTLDEDAREKRRAAADRIGQEISVPGSWRRWKKKFDWKARVDAWDAAQLEQEAADRADVLRVTRAALFDELEGLVRHLVTIGTSGYGMVNVVAIKTLLDLGDIKRLLAAGDVAAAGAGFSLERVKDLERQLDSGELDDADPRDLAALYQDALDASD